MAEKPPAWYDAKYAKPYREELYYELYDKLYQLAGPCVSSVIDLGCGTGAMLDRWPKPRPLRMTGVDFSRTAIDIARKRLDKGVDLYVYDLRKWRAISNKVGRYELAVCVETLEHIREDRSVFMLAKYLARRVICAVPYGNKIPAEAHIEGRFYDFAEVESRYGVMDRTERFGPFLIFVWSGGD